MTTTPRLRPAARGLIIDESDRILLCRIDLPHVVVWCAPGGGVDPAETTLQGLRRELTEEVGLGLEAEPRHVWHQEVVADGHAAGYDGVINDYFLIRTSHFTPRGSWSDEVLAAESIGGFRWWTVAEIDDHEGAAVFSPRALGALLKPILAGDLPEPPVQLGI